MGPAELDAGAAAAEGIETWLASASGQAGGALELARRTAWLLVQWGAAGAALTRLLPWAGLELAGPLGSFLEITYVLLAVYGALFLKAVDVVVVAARFAARTVTSAAPTVDRGQLLAPPWARLEEELLSALGDRAGPPAAADSLAFSPSRARLRLFGGDSEEDVRVVFWRDSAAWCPYCMKTQFFLEESQISYRVEFVNMSCYGPKRQDFLAISPRGLLPVAQIDGQVVADSDAIILRASRLACARTRGPPLRPQAGDPLLAESLRLVDLAKECQAVWLSWLRSPVNDAEGERRVTDCLDEVEAALARNAAGGPFMLGRLSVVECHLAPVLERMSASLAYFKGFFVRRPSSPDGRWPRIERWFAAMEGRPAYRSLAGDFYTHAHDLPPQLGSCGPNGRGAACQAHVDGSPGSGAWLLPLPPADPVEPVLAPWPPGAQADADAAARLEAAGALARNHGAVVEFCLRALSPPGLPPARAELADPANAGWGATEGDRALVDCALRHVVWHLVCGGGRPFARSDLSPALYEAGAEERWHSCLRYLQLRVGVPRDMGAAAARQLRAHVGSALAA